LIFEDRRIADALVDAIQPGLRLVTQCLPIRGDIVHHFVQLCFISVKHQVYQLGAALHGTIHCLAEAARLSAQLLKK